MWALTMCRSLFNVDRCGSTVPASSSTNRCPTGCRSPRCHRPRHSGPTRRAAFWIPSCRTISATW